MKIDVVHHQADDKQTITELHLLLREAQLTLAQCQRQFPESSKFDRIADKCSVVRGKIDRVADDICRNEQSATPNEKYLMESPYHAFNLTKKSEAIVTGPSFKHYCVSTLEKDNVSSYSCPESRKQKQNSTSLSELQIRLESSEILLRSLSLFLLNENKSNLPENLQKMILGYFGGIPIRKYQAQKSKPSQSENH